MKLYADTLSKQDRVYGLHTYTHAVNDMTRRSCLSPPTPRSRRTRQPMNSIFMWSTSVNYTLTTQAGSQFAQDVATNISWLPTTVIQT